jgi:hypothetical protein
MMLKKIQSDAEIRDQTLYRLEVVSAYIRFSVAMQIDVRLRCSSRQLFRMQKW